MTVAIISFVRQYKNKRGLALNAPIEKLTIDCDSDIQKKLEDVFDDIKGTVKVNNIELLFNYYNSYHPWGTNDE